MNKIYLCHRYFKTLLFFKGYHHKDTKNALKTLKNELKLYKLDETREYVCA